MVGKQSRNKVNHTADDEKYGEDLLMLFYAVLDELDSSSSSDGEGEAAKITPAPVKSRTKELINHLVWERLVWEI